MAIIRFSRSGYKGWAGLKKGELLTAAEGDGFEVFITGDLTLSYEQNLTGRRVAIVVLSSIDWHILKENPSPILAAIDNATPGSFGKSSAAPLAGRSRQTSSPRPCFLRREAQ